MTAIVQPVRSFATDDTSMVFRRVQPAARPEGSSPDTLTALREAPTRRKLEIDARLRPYLPTLLSIIDLELLDDDWDGHGGRPATMTAIRSAIEVIGAHPRLLAMPHVGPRPDGGVHIEWDRHTPQIELDVEPDGVITVLVETEDDDWDDYEFRDPGDPELHRLLAAVAR